MWQSLTEPPKFGAQPPSLIPANFPAIRYVLSLCSVYHMMETGWVKVSSTDVKDLHYQYQKEKAEEKPEPGT